MMARSGGELGVAQGAQFPAQRLSAHRDGEFLPNPLPQVDQPPPDDAMDRGQRTALNDLHQGAALFLVKGGRLARRLAVDQAVRATGAEAQNPIPDHLKPDAANPSCLCPGSTVVNLG